jgi:hypothetical protein
MIDSERLCVVGGFDNHGVTNTTEILDLATCALDDPPEPVEERELAAGRFVYGPSLATNRASCAGVKMDARRAIVMGGYDGIARHASTEILDFRSMQFLPGPPLLQPRSGHAAILMEQETLLIAGGFVGKMSSADDDEDDDSDAEAANGGHDEPEATPKADDLRPETKPSANGGGFEDTVATDNAALPADDAGEGDTGDQVAASGAADVADAVGSRSQSETASAIASRVGSHAPTGVKEPAKDAPVKVESRSVSKANKNGTLHCEKDRCHDTCELLRFDSSPQDAADDEEELKFEEGLQMSRRRAYFGLAVFVTVEVEDDYESEDGASDKDD